MKTSKVTERVGRLSILLRSFVFITVVSALVALLALPTVTADSPTIQMRRVLEPFLLLYPDETTNSQSAIPSCEVSKDDEDVQRTVDDRKINDVDRDEKTKQECHYGESTTATTSSDGITAIPIDFDLASRIEGKECQIVTVELKPNQVLRAESGAMMYMTQGVSMETSTGGGIAAGMKRMMTGQNFFLSDYRYTGAEGTTGLVCLGTDFPSKIIRLDLDDYGGKIVCQQGALLCASHTVDIEMEFTKKLSTGFFGGEGFILQALLGTGSVFVKAGGAIIRKELEDGESLRISSGCLVAFTQQVSYDIQIVQGFKNVLFGGEGLFLTTLTGPGTVWLQGMPPQRMISEIARRIPSRLGDALGSMVKNYCDKKENKKS